MARVIVEQSFETPMSEEEYGKLAKRLDPCLEVRDAIWLRSYVSIDKRRVTCEFEAPDAESVREAMRSAEVKFDRVWAAELFAVEMYPEWIKKLEEYRARHALK